MSRISKPISTISYNSELFLKQTLDALITLKTISYYEFIVHLPDKDDKKQHIHLYIVPNRALDLAVFGDTFIEKDPNNDKPLRCMPFRKSNNYGDWYWYGIHDKDYLRAKQLERNMFYTDADIVTSDADFHRTLVCENPLINYAHMSDIAIRDFICSAVYNGQSLESCLSSGLIPLGKTQSAIALYTALLPCVQGRRKMNIRADIQSKKDIKSNIKEIQLKENDSLPFEDTQVSVYDELF